MLVVDALRALIVTLTVALSLAVVARLVQKLYPFELPWQPVLIGLSAGAVVVAMVMAVVRRKSETAVARQVDEAAGLRASLGTALFLGKADAAWDRNVIDSARETARKVDVNAAVPVAVPARWPVPVALGLALAIVWWLPTYDVTGLFEEKADQEQQEKAFVEVKEDLAEKQKKLEVAVKKAGLKMEEPPEMIEPTNPLDPNAPTSPEELKRAAIKELTKVEDQLKSMIESEKGAEVQAMQDAMRRLTDPGPGPASEMARAMAKGDFAEAQDELEKLMDDVKNGEMTPEQKREAADQLEQLKDQMQQMAQSQEQMKEQLQAAGFSEEQAKKMAASADEMQKQLDQNPQVSDQQKQQLQQAASAQRKASDAMSALSQSMGQMAQGMQNSQGQQSQDGMEQAGESMSGQLGDMAGMKADMAAAQAALGECQGQMAAIGESMGAGQGSGQSFGTGQPGATGQWQQGQSSQMGSGSGKPGQGNGAGPDAVATDFALKMEKSNVNTTDGPVIASSLVYGQQVRGESKAAFGSAVSSGSAEAAEAIDTRRVPREHEAAVRAYFSTLQQQAAQNQSDDADDGE